MNTWPRWIVSLYQGPACETLDDAWNVVARALRAGHDFGANCVVFPELFLSGYNQADKIRAIAEPCGSAIDQKCATLARECGCALVIGWPERHNDQIYNAASCYDANGQKLGHYRKIQLFGDHEKSIFTHGTQYCVFEFQGRSCAILICYDVEFAAHIRALADQGVEVIFAPTANPTAFDYVPRHLVPARAAETNTTLIYANYCGEEAGLSFGGQSLIVAPNAEILAQAGHQEAMLIAQIPFSKKGTSEQKTEYKEVSK